MSQNMWKYNDCEFEVDFEDADFMERYWDAVDHLGKTEKELNDQVPDRNFLRSYCKMFYRFFDELFGDGSGDKILNGKYNARECEAAYDSLITFGSERVRAVNTARLNRAQRRAQSNNRRNKPNHNSRGRR